jgi:hypothetical protein
LSNICHRIKWKHQHPHRYYIVLGTVVVCDTIQLFYRDIKLPEHKKIWLEEE